MKFYYYYFIFLNILFNLLYELQEDYEKKRLYWLKSDWFYGLDDFLCNVTIITHYFLISSNQYFKMHLYISISKIEESCMYFFELKFVEEFRHQQTWSKLIILELYYEVEKI